MVGGSEDGESRRRSPRMETELAVQVLGHLRDGRHLDEPASVDQVSSHGLRLTIGTELPTGSEVVVHYPDRGEEVRYRVVWMTPKDEGSTWQMGLELIEGGPPPPEPEPPPTDLY